MESVYFAGCNFKTTEKSGLNLGIFERVCRNFRMEQRLISENLFEKLLYVAV